MDNSLLLSKYIYSTLKSIDLFEDKVFPLIAHADTKFPYIVFSKSVTPVYTKSYLSENIITVNFNIYTDDYEQSIDLVNVVRNLFENKTYHCNDFNISQAHVVVIDEDFIDDAYNQSVTIEFRL